jgi:hypothetical protein
MMQQPVVVEFCNEAQHLGRDMECKLLAEVEHRLPELQKCHPYLQKVVVALEQPVQRELSNLYQGQVVVYDGLSKLHTTARQVSPLAALKEALVAMELDLQREC